MVEDESGLHPRLVLRTISARAAALRLLRLSIPLQFVAAAVVFGAAANVSACQVKPDASRGIPGPTPLSGMATPPSLGVDAPRLVAEAFSFEHNFTHHLGTVPMDKKTATAFTVQNVGTAALAIANTWTSCMCMTTVLDKRELSPGETTVLHVVYDPKVDRTYGRFIQVLIHIRSNDPVMPLWEASITADVAEKSAER